MTLRRSARTVSVCVLTTMPSAQGVVHEAGTLTSVVLNQDSKSRQEPNGSRLSVAQSLGMVTPTSVAARRTDVPAGTSTRRPSIVTDTDAASGTAGVPKSTSGSQMLWLIRVLRSARFPGARSPRGSA